MDKTKVLKRLHEADEILRTLEEQVPKKRSTIENVRWILRDAREEVAAPDSPVQITEKELLQ